MLSLFPSEHILSQSGDNSFILTTHRLYQEEKSFSSTKTKSIMLEHITSCESFNKKYYFWLIITLMSLLALSVRDFEGIGALVGIVSVALFFLTKRTFIKIASPSSQILVNIKGMSQNEIYKIIEKIEHAKVQRIESLK